MTDAPHGRGDPAVDGSGLTVEVAGPADVDALADLRAAWLSENDPTPTNGATTIATPELRADFGRWFRAEADHRIFWIARRSGTPVAMVNLTVFQRMPSGGTQPGSWGYLGNMFVLPGHRDRGVGSVLLNAVLARADADDMALVLLHPSHRSVPFYARHGFAPDHERMVRRPPG